MFSCYFVNDPSCYFVNDPSCYFVNDPSCYFVNDHSCYFVNDSSCYFVNDPYCNFVNDHSCYFVNDPSCYFVNDPSCCFSWWGSGGLTVRTSRLTCNRSVVSSNPNKGSHSFLEQETLPSLLSTGWFQERIRIRFHNRTKINLVLRQIDINLII